MPSPAASPPLASSVAAAIALVLASCVQMPWAAPALEAATSGGYVGTERVLALDAFFLATDTTGSCRLERADGASAAPADFTRLETASLAGRKWTVDERAYERARRDIDALVLRVHDESGTRLWLRNAPTADGASAARSWRCAVGVAQVASLAPKRAARVVRLDLASPACGALTLVFGDRRDLTLAPYNVVDAWLFAGAPPDPSEAARGDAGALALGVSLEAEGRKKRLTVPAPVLDRCFAPADAPPPDAAEAARVATWLQTADEREAPPDATVETFAQLAGVDLARCSRQGSAGLEHVDCRAPIAELVEVPGEGPFGPPSWRVARRRVASGLHFFAGKPLPPREVAWSNVALRTVRAPGEGSASLTAALGRAAEEPALRDARAQYGARLLRASDLGPLVAASAWVDVTVHDVGAPTRAERALRRAAASTGTDKAARAAARAQRDAARGRLERALFAATGGKAGAVLGARLTPDGALPGAGAPADDAPSRDAEGGERASQPATRDGASLVVQGGEVDLTVSVVDAARRATAGGGRRKVRYETVGEAGHEPTDDEIGAAVLAAIASAVDDGVEQWALERALGGEVGPLLPGSRARLVATARAATPERELRRLADARDERATSDARSAYALTLPADAPNRCFTFAATASEPHAEIELLLGRLGTAAGRVWPIARDARRRGTAAFELCSLLPGEYRLELGSAPDGAAVTVGLFDSTPRKGTAADTRAAARGEAPRRTYGGAVRWDVPASPVAVPFAKPLASAAPPPPPPTTGDRDRDGDGVPDARDRCPDDPETPNGTLDEDGCPDEAPRP